MAPFLSVPSFALPYNRIMGLLEVSSVVDQCVLLLWAAHTKLFVLKLVDDDADLQGIAGLLADARDHSVQAKGVVQKLRGELSQVPLKQSMHFLGQWVDSFEEYIRLCIAHLVHVISMRLDKATKEVDAAGRGRS